MTRKLIFTLQLVISFAITAKAQEVLFTAEFHQQSAQEVILNIEEQTNMKFYFQDSWLDSLELSGSFVKEPLSDALKELFTGTSLSFYLTGNRVILLDNTAIIAQPAILNAALEEKSETKSVERGLIFSREYQNQVQDQSDLENYVFEIGNRNNMQTGGSATIAGYVKNNETGEPVEGALVYVQNPFKATSTDQSGFYTITLPTGKHQLIIQSVGMINTQRNVVLFSSGKLNIDMAIDVIALQEVTVQSDRDQNVQSVQMGLNKINVEEVKTVPIVLGEKDIMKIATTKAGVQTVGEGAAGYNVRGGKADQNLILINDAPVYRASHFFGFFSVFNSDAIASMDLFKSGIPAMYGGRLSSVFDIKSKQANKETFKGEGGVSPITSRLTLEIPLIKGKTSLLVGGRTTYSNWILKQVKSAGFNSNKVSFYDLITRIDHEVDEKNTITLSSYMSSDKFRLNSDTLFSFSNFSYQNTNGSLKWNHQFNSNLEGTLSGIFARYQYDLKYDESAPNAFVQSFGIQEASVKADFNYYIDDVHKINFGAGSKRYDVNPGSKSALGNESIILGQKVQHEQGIESALYVSDQYNVNKNLTLYGGLRYSMFNALGPMDVYQYQAGLPKNGDTETDSVVYGKNKTIKTFSGAEWRVSARYALDNLSSIKLSTSRNRQYIHTMSNSASLSPTDTWRLSGTYLKPQIADQVSLGYYRNFMRSTLEFSVEGYYKHIQNIVDFKTGATFLLNQNIERAVLQGLGKSYGVEFSLNKTGRLNGWLNYTYARTFIKLDGKFAEERVNGGNYYPASFDRPNTVNMVANYKLTRRLSFSMNVTYKTGRPVTVPVAAFDFKGAQNIYFSDRNAYRIPDYFRIDLGVNLEGNHRIQKLSHSFWSFSIYNLTGRDNPYSVFFDVKNGHVVGSKLIVFGNPIPTLSYNFKF